MEEGWRLTKRQDKLDTFSGRNDKAPKCDHALRGFILHRKQRSFLLHNLDASCLIARFHPNDIETLRERGQVANSLTGCHRTSQHAFACRSIDLPRQAA